MSASTVLIAISVASVAFLIYVFVALCKESRSGACRVVHILRNPDHIPEMSQDADDEAIQTNALAPTQRFVTVDRRAVLRHLRVGR